MVAKSSIPTDINLATAPAPRISGTSFERQADTGFAQRAMASGGGTSSPTVATTVAGFETQLAHLGNDLRSSLRDRLNTL